MLLDLTDFVRNEVPNDGNPWPWPCDTDGYSRKDGYFPKKGLGIPSSPSASATPFIATFFTAWEVSKQCFIAATAFSASLEDTDQEQISIDCH